jgi:hypothetical protein
LGVRRHAAACKRADAKTEEDYRRAAYFVMPRNVFLGPRRDSGAVRHHAFAAAAPAGSLVWWPVTYA